MNRVDAVLARDRLPRLGDNLEFLGLIWAVDHAVAMTSKRMAATIGVTGPQRIVIRVVGRFPGIPAGQLAELLHVHPSTLTGLLRRLERRGLIRRRPDSRDARRSLLGLTEKGRRLDVETKGTVEAVVAEILRSTPTEKLRATKEVLFALARALESGLDAPEASGVPK